MMLRPGDEDTMQDATGQPDWWKYTLDLPHGPRPRKPLCLLLGEHRSGGPRSPPRLALVAEAVRPHGRRARCSSSHYHWNLMPTEGRLPRRWSLLQPRGSVEARPRPTWTGGSRRKAHRRGVVGDAFDRTLRAHSPRPRVSMPASFRISISAARRLRLASSWVCSG